MKIRKFKVEQEDVDDVRVESIECCGIYEVSELSTRPVNIVVAMIKKVNKDYRMFIFHDAIKYKNGQKVAAFIRRHKLGSVVASRTVFNPNSSRNIKMWTYYPDWKALRKFMLERVDYKEGENFYGW